MSDEKTTPEAEQAATQPVTEQTETTEVKATTTPEGAEPKPEQSGSKETPEAEKSIFGGRAQKRIQQLVADKKRLEGELESLRTQKPPQDSPKDKVARYDDKIFDLEMKLFHTQHKDLTKDELGVVAAIAETQGYFDDESGDIDWDSAYSDYLRIVEKRGTAKPAPEEPPSATLGSAPANAKSIVTKPAGKLSDAELEKMLADKIRAKGGYH